MTARSPLAIKTLGYIVSGISVILLGIVSWESAGKHQFLALCLFGGMLASIIGMVLRWVSYRIEERQKGV